MPPRRSLVATVLCLVLLQAACLFAPPKALGQCAARPPDSKVRAAPSSGADPAAAAKPGAGCGALSVPRPATTDAPTQDAPTRTAVEATDLQAYFDAIGADAALWYQHVQTLADAAFEGRAPGTRGAELAAEYIEFYFRQYGLQPTFSGDTGQGPHAAAQAGKSYRQPLTLGGVLHAGDKSNGATAITRGTVEAAGVTTENVAAALPGKGRLKDEWIVIGGHYDAPGRPLQDSPCYAGGKLLPGADDNASGTAAVLVLAKRLTEAYAAHGDDATLRSILFIAFAAEETGLNGSRHFVEQPPIPLNKIHAMLNLDMVGRMRQDTLWLSGVGTATEFSSLLDPLLRESGLQVVAEPGGTGSDQVSFWNVGVPALFVMTGGHKELHSPADKASTMNPEGAGKVVDLVEKIAMRLAVHPGALTFAAQPNVTASGCCRQRPPGAKTGGAPSADDQPAALPDTPGGRCAAAFFEAFNSGEDERVREFEQRYRAASALAKRSIEDRIDQANTIRTDLGSLTPLRVVSTGTTEITIVARASRTGERLMMTFQLEDESPHGLVSVSITGPVAPDAEASSATLIDETLRKDTIKQIADALRESYVYPEVGARMAEVLAKHESEGRYDAVTSAGDLAQRLTTDLFAVCKDHHLSVRPHAGPMSAAACASDGDAGEDNRDNYGFRKPELLPGNIGYIKFDMFHASQRAQEVAAAALASVADCDALVFDLRQNGGGSPAMIRFISSYLFDKPTHLNSFYDRLNNKTSETWTLDTVPGKRFPSDLPVYVLTSSFTGSAAEEFTYNLKNLGRATVVGETTVGAAHPVTERIINDRFLVRVPYARAYNPITKKNWEGVGVSPDIQVPASEALEAACKDAADKISARRQAAARSAPGM
jgi:hypothetical protein